MSDQKLNKDIWPQERDVIMRPDRYKYVRKLLKPEGCVFCNASQAEMAFENLCLFKNADIMVVLNKYPYNTAHTMVLPRAHIGDYKMLSTSVVTQLALMKHKAIQILHDVYRPDGFNVGLNNGAVAGAGIPDHLHWHIVPRWSGDTNFFPVIAETKVLPENLEQSYARLKDKFSGL